MKEISDFARQIAANIKTNDDKNYSFDVTLIITIGSILINVLRLLMKCNVFGRDLVDRIQNPGPIDKILLRKAIKSGLSDDHLHLKDAIQKTLLEEVIKLSKDQINLMAMEAKNAR